MCIVLRVSETQSLATAMAGWTGDQLRLYVHLKRKLVSGVTWDLMSGECRPGHRPQWLHGVSLTAWVEPAGNSVRIIVMSVGFGDDDPLGGEPNPASTLHTTIRMAFLLHRQKGDMWWLEQIYGEPLFESGDAWVHNCRLELMSFMRRRKGGRARGSLGKIGDAGFARCVRGKLRYQKRIGMVPVEFGCHEMEMKTDGADGERFASSMSPACAVFSDDFRIRNDIIDRKMRDNDLFLLRDEWCAVLPMQATQRMIPGLSSRCLSPRSIQPLTPTLAACWGLAMNAGKPGVRSVKLDELAKFFVDHAEKAGLFSATPSHFVAQASFECPPPCSRILLAGQRHGFAATGNSRPPSAGGGKYSHWRDFIALDEVVAREGRLRNSWHGGGLSCTDAAWH